jgi:hypothetical protein
MLVPRRERRCVLPRHDVTLRMPTPDPKMEEIVEHVTWQGDRAPGLCIQ